MRLSNQVKRNDILGSDAGRQLIGAQLDQSLEHEVVSIDQEVQPDTEGLRLLNPESVSRQVLQDGLEVRFLDAADLDNLSGSFN